MNLRLLFVCVFAQASLSATNTIAENEATRNLENVFQLKEIQEQLQQMEEWKDAISKDVDILRRILWDNDESSSNTRRRRRHAMNENRQAAGFPPMNDCIPGTHGCPLQVTPFSAGSSCILCPNGPRGYPGPAGPPGRDGRDAIALISSADYLNTVSRNAHQDAIPPPSNTSGAVYVRWGHHECPTTSQLIYSGSVAGTHYADSGGGTDRLCLPENPVYDSPVAGIGVSRSFVYGVEYQINSFPELNSKEWHDVPCAVCLAATRFAKLVIPGTNVCPSADWTREYGGFLMAERSHASHNRAMHMCVDREMQTIPRTVGAASMRGLLNLVESRCSSTGGGISCGPYTDGYELTCAVCTK